MFNPLISAGTFLIQFIFETYILILMLRIVLQWVNTNPQNPLFMFIARLTDPLLQPMCRLLPALHGFDISATIVLLVLEVLKLYFLIGLENSLTVSPHLSGLVVLAFAQLLNQLINIFFYTIFGLAILSWIMPLAHGPIVEILVRITEPLLRPVRNCLPSIAGLDLSPVVVLVVLKLINIALVGSLLQIGSGLLV